MKKSLGVNELRRMYLEFFESKNHLAMKSFSLVPHNDNSLLLINAGMAPLKPYFTGQEIPPRNRVTTCQKCVRTGDIDNVGKTARHLTFFEMLGNFSFGDYFKEEAIEWSWEFLTKVLGLEEDRLYPSIYGEDDEAFEIWNKKVGVAADRITRFYRDPVTGECDNFWDAVCKRTRADGLHALGHHHARDGLRAKERLLLNRFQKRRKRQRAFRQRHARNQAKHTQHRSSRSPKPSAHNQFLPVLYCYKYNTLCRKKQPICAVAATVLTQ